MNWSDFLETLRLLKTAAKRAWVKAGLVNSEAISFVFNDEPFSVVAFEVSKTGFASDDGVLITKCSCLQIYWNCGQDTMDNRHVVDFHTFTN